MNILCTFFLSHKFSLGIGGKFSTFNLRGFLLLVIKSYYIGKNWTFYSYLSKKVTTYNKLNLFKVFNWNTFNITYFNLVKYINLKYNTLFKLNIALLALLKNKYQTKPCKKVIAVVNSF